MAKNEQWEVPVTFDLQILIRSTLRPGGRSFQIWSKFPPGASAGMGQMDRRMENPKTACVKKLLFISVMET